MNQVMKLGWNSDVTSVYYMMLDAKQKVVLRKDGPRHMTHDMIKSRGAFPPQALQPHYITGTNEAERDSDEYTLAGILQRRRRCPPHARP